VIRQVAYNLRGGFLVRPLIITLTLGCVGAALSFLEELIPGFSDFIPKLLLPSRSDPQVAQVILGSIAASIMTVVSIVFAILLMTLTLASMQFSPRIIVSFSRDRVTQWTLGIFLGTFTYCMAALPAAHSLPRPFAPVVTVLGAMLLALVCVGWLLFFIHHISRAISVNHIVDRIASETEVMIDDVMRWSHRPGRPDGDDPRRGYPWETTLTSQVSGYIRFLDTRRLVAVAKSHHVKVDVLRRVGHFVPAGVPLMKLSRGDRMQLDGSEELRGAFDFGPTRTLQQDVEFGVLQIVDIALKAISPAVNDPTTAIGSVDQLSRILIRFASRETPESTLYDPPGSFGFTFHGSALSGSWIRLSSKYACMPEAMSRSACASCVRWLTSLSLHPTRCSVEFSRSAAGESSRVVQAPSARKNWSHFVRGRRRSRISLPHLRRAPRT